MRFLLAAVLLAASAPLHAAALDPATLEQGADLAYRRALQPAAAEQRLNADRRLTRRVRSLSGRLLAGAASGDAVAADVAGTANVVTDAAVDVLAWPGARLLATTGLASGAALSDSELGAVLAHVIAHSLLGHDNARVAGLVPEALAQAADPNRRVLAVAEAARTASTQRPAPAEVAAADAKSIAMMAAAALDPRAAPVAWRKLHAAGAALVGRYPVDDARLAALEAAAGAAVPAFEEAAAKAAKAAAAPPAPRPPGVAPGGGTRQIR